MTETTLRGEHRPRDDADIVHAALNAGEILSNNSTGADTTSWAGCLSLAGTMHKLVWPYLQYGEKVVTLPQLEHLENVIVVLSNHIRMMSNAFSQARDNNINQDSNIPCVSTASVGQGVGSQSSILNGTHLSQCMGSEMCFTHQLQAILLMGVVKAYCCRSDYLRDSSAGDFKEGNMQFTLEEELWHTVRGLTIPCLKAFVTSLLKGNFPVETSSTSTAQAKLDLEWGRYALQRFSGRLLPGCCHLACSNFEGPSEASLPTKLCGGCRRARYCSLECQRAAWVKGGHSRVCFKKE